MNATHLSAIDFDTALSKLTESRMSVGELDELINNLGAIRPEYFHHKYEGGLCLQQVPGELSAASARLLDRFSGQDIRYLEVGVGSCGTLIYFAHLFQKHGIGFIPFAVDNFAYTSFLANQRTRVHWCEKNLGLQFLDGDSTQQNVRTWMGERRFDLILVDGDHSFEGCLIDFLTCLPHLERNGVFLFHDVRSQLCPGVGKVYDFAKRYFQDQKVFSHSSTCGIGMMEDWNGELPSSVDVARLCREHIKSLQLDHARKMSERDIEGVSLSVKRLAWKRLKQKAKRLLRHDG